MQTSSGRPFRPISSSLVVAVLGAPVLLLVGALGEGCVVPLSASPGAADGSASGTTASFEAGAAAESSSGLSGSSGSSGSAGSSGASPPPSGTWTNATGNLAGIMSECGNLAVVSAKPDEDLLIASVALVGLYGSRDGGNSWQPLGTGAGSATITNRGQVIVYDPMNSMRFWEAGIYHPDGVYETMDDGVTFTDLGNESPGDDVSVDFSDPNRQTLVAGGHEASGLLNLSTNGGMTWTSIAAGLPTMTNCTNSLIFDSKTFLVGCGGYNNGMPGIWRTTDQGATWTNVSTGGGVDAPLLASDGSVYWVGPGGSSVVRSTDQGMTWTTIISSQGVVNPAHAIELPDGRIALTGPNTLMVSADHGMTWNAASTTLPYQDSVGLTYSKQEKAFYIWHFSCASSGAPNPVPSDGVMKYAFDYESQ
jgi:hypothetical protein